MFEGLKDVGKLMKDAKKMKQQMQAVQEQLKKTLVEGKSKNKLVTVKMTGELLIIGIEIDPSLLNESKKSDIEKSILEASNDAATKAKKLATSQLGSISKGLNIPGM